LRMLVFGCLCVVADVCVYAAMTMVTFDTLLVQLQSCESQATLFVSFCALVSLFTDARLCVLVQLITDK
jgi:hypothetical protein